MSTRLLTITAVLVGLAIPASASAEKDLPFFVGGGIKGGVSGAVADAVNEGESVTIDGRTYSTGQGPDFYAMFGMGGGFGLSLESRFKNLIGLELGLHHSWDNGNGWEDLKDRFGNKIGRINQEQRTSSWHYPILLKLATPGDVVRFAFGLGVEIVSQSSTSLEWKGVDGVLLNCSAKSGETPPPCAGYGYIRSATTSTYVLTMLTIGMEFDLEQVRIPLEIRLGYNPGFSGDVDDRANVRLTNGRPDFEYLGQYQGQFGIYTGIIYDWETLL